MYLTDEGLKKIEEAADKHKNIQLLFLVDIYQMLKMLLKKQDDTGNSTKNQHKKGSERVKEKVVSCVKHSATEETLQSIDDTLKRIEKLLSNKTDIDIIVNGIVDSVEKVTEQI